MTYLIASLKHTNSGHEHIVFWGPNHRGYTPVVGEFVGHYNLFEAVHLNDGVDYIAVHEHVIPALLSPEPYYKAGGRFYDQSGPVIENTRTNWNALIAASIHSGRVRKPKPEVFRGKRRSGTITNQGS